jgi:hypothetical protein
LITSFLTNQTLSWKNTIRYHPYTAIFNALELPKDTLVVIGISKSILEEAISACLSLVNCKILLSQ